MPTEPQFRAVLDARVTFSNGGGLTAEAFRVDLPGPDADETLVGELFLGSLGLLLTDTVEISALRVVQEQHRGTPGSPSAAPACRGPARRLVDLSHPIRAGLVTYPGLPAPVDHAAPHPRGLPRASTRPAPSSRWTSSRMIGNTGTYLDSPFHRYADGADLAGLDLDRSSACPPRSSASTGSSASAASVGVLAERDVPRRGRAAAHRLGRALRARPSTASARRSSPGRAPRCLVDAGARAGGHRLAQHRRHRVRRRARPAHTLLLEAGIHVVEHLTNLGAAAARRAVHGGAAAVEGFGTFPVRAFASVPVEGGRG